MVQKYRHVRFPVEAYNDLTDKQRKMEKMAREILGGNKRIRIPLTKILIRTAKSPLFLKDDELRELLKK
jgi:hypothetical protein